MFFAINLFASNLLDYQIEQNINANWASYMAM
jgi:hypothetical protein